MDHDLQTRPSGPGLRDRHEEEDHETGDFSAARVSVVAMRVSCPSMPLLRNRGRLGHCLSKYLITRQL
jgi:hypothetical protein